MNEKNNGNHYGQDKEHDNNGNHGNGNNGKDHKIGNSHAMVIDDEE